MQKQELLDEIGNLINSSSVSTSGNSIKYTVILDTLFRTPQTDKVIRDNDEKIRQLLKDKKINSPKTNMRYGFARVNPIKNDNSQKILYDISPLNLKFSIDYILSSKKINRGILYEQNLKNIIKQSVFKIKKSYNLDRIEKTKIDGKEIDISLGKSKIEVKYLDNAREGIRLSRLNFAGLGINETYQSTSFYGLLPQFAKNQLDQFYERNKENMNKSDRVSLLLSGDACMKLFENHYSQSDYIQIHNMGLYSISGKNPTELKEIKNFNIKDGKLIFRIKDGAKKADGTYYLQIKAELSDCIVDNIYGSNNTISLDNDMFLNKFIENSIN